MQLRRKLLSEYVSVTGIAGLCLIASLSQHNCVELHRNRPRLGNLQQCCCNICRTASLEDTAFEPVAELDVKSAEPVSEPNAVTEAEPTSSAELTQQTPESSEAAVDAILADMQDATELAVADQQVTLFLSYMDAHQHVHR